MKEYKFDPNIPKCTLCEWCDIRDRYRNRIGKMVRCKEFYICTLRDGDRISRLKEEAAKCPNYLPESHHLRKDGEKLQILFSAMAAAEKAKAIKEAKKVDTDKPLHVVFRGRLLHIEDYKKITERLERIERLKSHLQIIKEQPDTLLEQVAIESEITLLKKSVQEFLDKEPMDTNKNHNSKKSQQ